MLTKNKICSAFGCNKKSKDTVELEHEDGYKEMLTFCSEHSSSMAEDDGCLGWRIINYWEYVTD